MGLITIGNRFGLSSFELHSIRITLRLIWIMQTLDKTLKTSGIFSQTQIFNSVQYQGITSRWRESYMSDSDGNNLRKGGHDVITNRTSVTASAMLWISDQNVLALLSECLQCELVKVRKTYRHVSFSHSLFLCLLKASVYMHGFHVHVWWWWRCSCPQLGRALQ